MCAEEVTRPMVKAFQAKYREFWKGSWPDCETSRELIAAALAAAEEGSKVFRSTLEASLQSGSAGEVEPVAWRIFDKEEDEWWTTTIENLAKSWSKSTVVEPLFATPAKAAGGEPPFKPCITINDEAGITEATFEDVPCVAEPVFPGVYHWFDKHLAMDDGRLVGVALWSASPSPDGERQEGGAE